MLFGHSYQQIAIIVGIFVVSTVATSAIVAGYLVAMEADYFVVGQRGLARKIKSPALTIVFVVLKNLLGAFLVLAGVLLSLPGVPGQGLLTILVGVLLLDIPGKRRVLLRVIKRPAVNRAINGLRARFDKPPLLTQPVKVSRELDDVIEP